MFEVFANDYRITIQEIPLGNQGEDMARCLVIDITDAVNEFGSGGTVSVRNKRNGDELPYFCTNVSTVTGADAEGNVHTYIKWTLTDVDTAAAGSGFVQADYIISGVTVKTWVYKYFILPSLGITGDVPDPYEDILEEIEAQVAAVQAAAASAAASAAQASAEATRIISTTQEVVEDWLSDHIVTGYTVDDTLTISGAAADSATVGTQLRAAFVTEQTSGYIASFTDGADDVPVKSLVVNIEPVQSGGGYPSPSNVRAISGWTAAKITRAGKNLLTYPYSSTSGTWNGLSFSVQDDGRLVINGTATDATYFLLTPNINSTTTKPNWFVPGRRLKLCCNSITDNRGYVRIQVRYNSAPSTTVNLATVKTEGAVSFTVPNDVYQMNVHFAAYTGSTFDNFVLEPMICPASDTDATYEPYNGEVYNVSFGSAGTVYGGTLDVTSGMLTVTHYGIDMGTLTWQYVASSTVFRANKSTFPALPRFDFEGVATICSMFQSYDGALSSLPDKCFIPFDRDASATYFFVKDTDYTVGADFKTAVTGQTLVYELESPVSYQLTPTEVKTILGINNIWSDTGSVASCEYRADTKLYLEKLTNPDNDMTADANIASGQYFMVNNTLYLATAAIASGATITPGTNCTETSLAVALNAINA